MPPIRYRQRPAPQNNVEKPAKPTSKNNTNIVIIVLLIAVGIGIAGYYLFDPIKEMLTKPSVEEPNPITSPEPEETAEEAQPEPEPEPVAEPTTVAHKQESSSSVPKGFYIIIGSYQKTYYAEKLVKEVEKDIEAHVLHFEELGLYRVSVGSYDKLNKAYNDLNSIKDLDHCENAWVLENR